MRMIQRARMTWAIMPTWAKVADAIIAALTVAAVAWWW
jgi:hypothetical protein